MCHVSTSDGIVCVWFELRLIAVWLTESHKILKDKNDDRSRIVLDREQLAWHVCRQLSVVKFLALWGYACCLRYNTDVIDCRRVGTEGIRVEFSV